MHPLLIVSEKHKTNSKKQLDNSLDKGEVLQRLGDLKDGIDRGEVRVRSPRDEHDDLGESPCFPSKEVQRPRGRFYKRRGEGRRKSRKL